MSDTNKFMFSAKRLDNGGTLKFSLGQARLSASPDIMRIITNLGGTDDGAGIDPSTIKPLFTTAATSDVWLFENADKLSIAQIDDEQHVNLITQAWLYSEGDYSELHVFIEDSPDTVPFWILVNGKHDVLDMNRIYRVKAPGYSVEDLINNISDCQGIDNPIDAVHDCLRHVTDYLKANGLDTQGVGS